MKSSTAMNARLSLLIYLGLTANSLAQVEVQPNGDTILGTPGATPPTSTTVNGPLTVNGAATLGAPDAVPAASTRVNGPLTVSGAAVLGTTGAVSATPTTINGPLTVNGTTILSGAVTIGTTADPANLSVNGSFEAFGTVPVGAIVDYWPPDSSNIKIPSNFKICDGQTIDDPSSPYHGKAIPNLVDRFVLGTDRKNRIGFTGGKSDQTLNVTINLPEQTGGIGSSIPNDIVLQTYTLVSRRNVAERGFWRYSLVERGDNPDLAWNDGQHVHNLGESITPKTSAIERPPYMALFKLIRIK